MDFLFDLFLGAFKFQMYKRLMFVLQVASSKKKGKVGEETKAGRPYFYSHAHSF